MQIDLISFDIDDTLIDFRETLTHALTTIAEFLSAETGTLFTARILQDARNHFAAQPEAQGMALLDIRRAGFAKALDTHQAHLADPAMDMFTTLRFDHMPLIPGVLDILTELGAKYPLAVLSNGNSYPARIGIAQFFQHIFLEDNLPHLKPDPRAFHALADAAGTTATQVVHIGDSFGDDVIGARAAGAVPIWFNPKGQPVPGGADAPLELRDFHDLPALLAELA
jgi:putative hydrolase of the HAD superfamily